MENSMKRAYSEVNTILCMLDEEYIQRIPKKVQQFFKDEMDKEYKPKIDSEILLINQNLQKETLILLAIINLNYWCDENESQELLNLYSENDKKSEQKLNEKYSYANLFKDSKVEIPAKQMQNKTSNQLVVYNNKENCIKKILNKIKLLLNFCKK